MTWSILWLVNALQGVVKNLSSFGRAIAKKIVQIAKELMEATVSPVVMELMAIGTTQNLGTKAMR